MYSQSGVIFYREHKEKDGVKTPLGFRHPVLVSPEKIALILSQIAFREDHVFRNAVDKYIFTPEEVAAAAKPLSVELAKISPDERLRFLITRSNWTDVFTGVSGTSGVIFSSEEGILQIVFDRIQEHVAGAEEGKPMQVVFRVEPTENLDASPILLREGMRLHQDDLTGKTFPRWAEVRLAEVKSSLPPGQATKDEKTSPAGKPANDEAYERIRERLELLKRLRADGALTQEEYEKEKEKALEGTAKD